MSKPKQMPGSGRGNRGVVVNQEMDRPDCPECGGFMKSNGVKMWCCTDCGKKLTKVTKDEGIKRFNDALGFDPIPAEALARKCEKSKRIIISSAQNNSELDHSFFKALKQAADYYNCPLAVIPSHYRNVTLWSKEDTKEFDPFVKPYLVKSDIQFGDVKIRPDVKIPPTTLNPLSGKHAHAGRDWLVFGHPQLAREPVATLGDGMPKVMFTTGSVTKPNYTQSDAGYKAEFHHCNAALILEKCGDDVFIRQLMANDKGHIYDLDLRFTPNGYSSGHKAVAITMGDEHVKFNIIEKETYGKGGLVDLLKPKYIVRHDVLDGYAGSHHHEKEPMVQFLKHHSGDNDYRAEVEQAIDFINRTTPSYATNLIVPSNHHDHLTKFLNRVDLKEDHTNAIFIAELQLAMRKSALKGENFDPFYLYAKDRITVKTTWLERSQPFLIDGVDHSQHGDVGPNGSRGSPVGFARTPDPMTAGHIHKLLIKMGFFSSGTSTGRLEYEKGLSDHSNGHVVQYKGGKRACIDFINGRFRAPPPRLKK